MTTDQRTISIRGESTDGQMLEATFAPDKGMNLLSYKKGDIEVIDQSTKGLFDERCAGLGALIGPHFHHRNSRIVPPVEDKSLFPHLAALRAKGVKEPFSHGIARYVPWKVEASDNRIHAELSGKDEWKGVPIAQLEGQDFTMTYTASLESSGLNI